MPAVIAAIYLLLALRIRILLEVSFCGAEGNIALRAGVSGLYIRFDGIIKRKGVAFSVVPRYSVQAKKKHSGKAHRKSLRIVRLYLWFARSGRMERMGVRARVGLNDAGKTAMAAGCMRALAHAAFSRVDCEALAEISVMPDFERGGFAGYAYCLFSCQMGDIIAAAIRYALKVKKKHKNEQDASQR